MNIGRTKCGWLAALSTMAMLACGHALALSTLPLDLDQLVSGAQDIAHVRCTDSRVERDPVAGLVTVTNFVVFDRVKGATGASLTVRQPGGELDGMAVDYHVPRFTAGNEYVLFMPAASRLGLASPLGFEQGVYRVSAGAGPSGKTAGNGRDFRELLAGISPSSVPKAMAGLLTPTAGQRTEVDLADFMNLLRARVGTR